MPCSHPFSHVLAADIYYAALELVREHVLVDGTLGYNVDLQGSASVQSHTCCVASGKPIILPQQLENSSLILLGVLGALEIAD